MIGNASSLMVIQLLNMLIPIIMMPVLISSIGVNNFGIIAFAGYFSGILLIACDYGFVYTGPQQVSHNQTDTAFLSRLFSTITAIKLLFFLLSILVTVAFCFFYKVLSAEEKKVMFISLLAVAGNILTPVWFLQGIQQLRSLTIVTVIFKILQLGMLILFVSSKSDLILASLLFFGSNFLLGLVVFIYTVIKFNLRLNVPGRKDLLDQLQKGFNMFLSVFFSSIYIQGTGLMLGLLTGNNQTVAYYNSAEKIVRALTGLFNPLIQAFYPFISKLFLVDKKMAKVLFFKFFKLILIIAFVAAGALALMAGFIVDVLFGNTFEPAIVLIWILSPIVVFGNAGNMLGNNLFVHLKWEKTTVYVMFILAVVSMLLSYVLVNHYLANGAAISLLIVEALGAFLFFVYYSWKKAGIA